VELLILIYVIGDELVLVVYLVNFAVFQLFDIADDDYAAMMHCVEELIDGLFNFIFFNKIAKY